MMEDFSQLSHFFYPRNIAVIGVSPKRANLGKNIVHNCLTLGFQGEILPVGLREGVAFGQRIYPSLDEIDRDIDLAVILTPAKTIPGILEQCGRKGIKWAVIESAGFSELGDKGKPIEEACVRMAEKHGLRFIGPNCIGVANLENGLALPFMPLREDLRLGSVSVLSQSGGVGLSYLGFLAEENIGINKFVSMGNKLNVDENDLLMYLIQDKGTKIILVYLEGFTNGIRFMEIASRSQKPVLVHKSNRFETSAGIAHSHTAALFANDKLVDFALEQAGCLRVTTVGDAIDSIKSLSLPPLKGNRLAVVSRSGGHAVIAADACAHFGFQLPRFPEEILKRIESRLRARVIRLQNPLDLGDLFDLEFYQSIVEELLKQDYVDGVLLGHGYPRGPEQAASRLLIDRVGELVHQYRKPVALVILVEAMEIDYLKKNSKIPVFSAPENAMRAFYNSYKWASRSVSPPEIRLLEDADREKAKRILKGADSRDHLALSEAMELVKGYGLPVPPYALARTKEEAVQAWRSLKGPVAMKVNWPHISHKSDAGAVVLDLNSEDRIITAFNHLQTKAGSDMEVMIQSMASGGREVILGGKRDHVFGPIVMFGLGGIFVEVLEDVVWRMAPLSQQEARRMIQSIKAAKVLDGLRGDKPYDTEAVADLLVRLSQILLEHPSIQEIDINPVMVFHEGKGARALDARIVLNKDYSG